MTPSQHLESVLTTEAPIEGALERLQNPQVVRLLHGLVTIVTEVGEALDVVKKHVYYGKEFDAAQMVNLIEEVGDIQWGCGLSVDAINNLCTEYSVNPVTCEVVLERNHKKLANRYPTGFTQKHALQRDLVNEQSVLSGN